jgi:hypothetical protein
MIVDAKLSRLQDKVKKDESYKETLERLLIKKTGKEHTIYMIMYLESL